MHWPIQKQDQTVTEKANVQVDDANNDSMKVWAGGRGTTATKCHGERLPDGAIRNRVACMKANVRLLLLLQLLSMNRGRDGCNVQYGSTRDHALDEIT